MPSPAPQGGGLRPRNLGKDQLNLFKAVSRDEGAGRVNNTIPHEDPGFTYHSVQSDSAAYFQPHPSHSVRFLLPLEFCGTARFRRGAGVAEVVMRRWCVGTQALVLPRLGRSFCSRASTPASHSHLQYRTPNGQDVLAYRPLAPEARLEVDKKGVVIPLNNQMRKKGWRVEFTFTVRLNIATRSGDIFDRSLPLRLALPRGVVAAPGEGAEQV
ncbi:hypothetical protein EDB84DRAFT_1441596 [Lactarius hengduanensis]|nr:hypothetical protein EDB84DRAFT_1441596 [Lactarius hengduanensis]